MLKNTTSHIITCMVAFLFMACDSSHKPEQAAEQTPQALAEQYRPDSSTIVHEVIKAQWNKKPVILACYEQSFREGEEDLSRVIIQLFEKTSRAPHQFVVDTIGPEGGAPHIESIFFANADTDKAEELLVLVSWKQMHRDVSGTLYATMVYDDLLDEQDHKLNYLADISKKLDGGCDCSHAEGENSKAKFKTAEEVKNELLRLGY